MGALTNWSGVFYPTGEFDTQIGLQEKNTPLSPHANVTKQHCSNYLVLGMPDVDNLELTWCTNLVSHADYCLWVNQFYSENVPIYSRKKCPITLTLLCCKLMDTHQT